MKKCDPLGYPDEDESPKSLSAESPCHGIISITRLFAFVGTGAL